MREERIEALLRRQPLRRLDQRLLSLFREFGLHELSVVTRS